MNLRNCNGVPLVFWAGMSAAALSWAANRPESKAVPEGIKTQALANYGKLPLSFEENRGQADARVKFLSQGKGYTLLLTPDAVELNLTQPQRDKHAALRMSFPGAQPSPRVSGDGRQAAISSYFVGNDPAKWVSGAPNYARIRYQQLYPGVDLVFYGNQRQLEYDLVVAPGTDPGAIRMQFDGVDSMRLDGAGDLVLRAGAGEFRQHRPIVYQERDGARQSVDGRYVLQAHNRVAFEIAPYDNRKPLIIDPVLGFATYLGTPGEELQGLSAAADNATYPAVAVDSLGNVYVAGFNGGTAAQFPGNIGSQGIGGGGTEVFVVKMNSTGTALAYSVVFGGGETDVGGGIAVDTSGNAYVTGYTSSPNFPITAGAPQSSLQGGTNAFVAKVNATGTALAYSTYLGGSGNYWGRAIAVDTTGSAYVTGTAQEMAGTSFPLVNPISSTPASGFLTKVNSGGTAFVYSTYLSAGIGYGIALDGSADAYIAGTTGTSTLPSPAQAYVLKVNAAGSAIDYGPVLLGHTGTGLQSVGFGIAVDSSDNAYVTGMTNDLSFPVTGGAAQTTYGGGLTDAFAVKLGSTGTPIYATYIGGIGSNIIPERGSGIGVDAAGYAYVSGTTQCIGFPVTSPITGALNGSPAVLMQGTVTAGSPPTSTWTPNAMAGRFDEVTAIAFDASGNIYAGATALDVTSGGGIYKSTNGGVDFVPATSGITSTSIDAIAVDPNNSADVYAIAGSRIYLSTNSGTSWTAVGPAVGTSGSLAIAKTSPSTIYAGSSTGLLYSTNTGATWNSTTVPMPVASLVVDPNNAEIAYAGTGAGVYKTINGGGSWSAVNTGLPIIPAVSSLAINSASTLYAATGSGLYYTSNGGTGWTQISELILGIPSTPLLVAVDSGNNVYLAFEGSGIAVGVDGGTAAGDWSPLTYNGLSQNQILVLAAKPGVSGTAFAGMVSATDAFLTRISPNGGSFSSSTCIGGSNNNLGQNIAVTAGGAVYISGATVAENFPSTPGVIQPTLAGNYDAFVAVVYSTTAITSSPSGASLTVTGSGCAAGSYTTPATLAWSAGETCTITFADPITSGGLQYEFESSTVNGSAVSHTNPLTVNSGDGIVLINADYSVVSGTGPGTATHFSVTAPSTATAGIPIQFTVTALNSSNQTATTYTSPVHFTSTDPKANLPADATLTNGVGTFTASLVTAGVTTITASDLLSSSINGTSGNIAVSLSTSGLRFIAMPPCRVVDTRDPTKPAGFGPPSLAAGVTRSFSLPDGACGIPSTAQAYSLNVTVVPVGPLGYLTVWPTGQSQPLVSTLNSPEGEVQANAAIVAAGTGGAISVFATNNTDLVLDINGYFVPSTDSSALGFYPITPCRLVDTRPGAPSTVITGELIGSTSTTLPLLSSPIGTAPSSCHIPATAQAYSLNFTLVPPGPVSYLTVYPTGESLPIVSTLNDPTGTVEANAAIAPAGTGGSIEAFVTQTTDLLVDINGYFAPVGDGALSLYAMPPCRVLDSRNPPGAPPFVGAINVDVLGSDCGGTSAAQAYVFNATVVPQGFLGYLTLWPEGGLQPVVSTLNAYNGEVTSNMAIVPTTNTDISAYATNDTYLVLDMFGYFAP